MRIVAAINKTKITFIKNVTNCLMIEINVCSCQSFSQFVQRLRFIQPSKRTRFQDQPFQFRSFVPNERASFFQWFYHAATAISVQNVLMITNIIMSTLFSCVIVLQPVCSSCVFSTQNIICTIKQIIDKGQEYSVKNLLN